VQLVLNWLQIKKRSQKSNLNLIMSSPLELRRVQLLERRMLGEDHAPSNSRGKAGSNSNSIDYYPTNNSNGNEFGNAITVAKDGSSSTHILQPNSSDSNGSIENKQNHSKQKKQQQSTGKKKNGKQLILNTNGTISDISNAIDIDTANNDPIDINFGHSHDSNHSNSMSRISPLRAPNTVDSKNQMKGKGKANNASSSSSSSSSSTTTTTTAQSERSNTRSSSKIGDKRKLSTNAGGSGSSSVGLDINSVLKHVDVDIIDHQESATTGLDDDMNELPVSKTAKTSPNVGPGHGHSHGQGQGVSDSSQSHDENASLSQHGSDHNNSRSGRGHGNGNGNAANTSNTRGIKQYFSSNQNNNGQDLTKFFSQTNNNNQAANGGCDENAMDVQNSTTGASTSSSIGASSSAAAASSSSAHSSGEVKGRKKSSKNTNSNDMMPPPAIGANVINVGQTHIDKEVRKQIEILRMGKDASDNKLHRVEIEMTQAQTRQKILEERNIKVIKKLEDIQREMAQKEARRKRDRLALDCVRLGKVTTVRTSATTFGEVWEEGYALKELTKKTQALVERREELTRRKNDLTSLKRKTKAKANKEAKAATAADSGANNAAAAAAAVAVSLGVNMPQLNSSGSTYDSSDPEAAIAELDFVAETEAIQSHLNQLKKDEIENENAKKILDTEKAAHQKELKRCSSEDKSRFYKTLPCLNKRYLLISMLGRGGFSEVWKALDLLDLRDVAIKIHQLNPTWNEDRKNTYIRHVTREYTIHREMMHPRVVQLFDVFEIDNNSFATVLELCRGIDLDEKLKRNKLLNERDARTVLLQIISGLRYLNMPSIEYGNNEDNCNINSNNNNNNNNGNDNGNQPASSGGTGKRRAIIHYDLKPANILFDEMGDAKITDFGLSKIIDDTTDDESLELTSQGAGTYWYLPPECFAKGDENGKGPRVSSKVDVWSVGVIFYQMLYGKRPFGEGKSQELVLREGVILNAHQVEFPSNGPKVSEEAKDLIRQCLTHSKEHRPDVYTLCMHHYLTSKMKV
jgi:tousled-like kinase